MTTRAVLGVWTLALLVAAGATLLVATSDHETDKLPTILLAVPTALAFVASGIIARAQRPANAIGILLIVVGFAWALGALSTANNDYVFTAGLALGTIFTALLGHLFLAFPTGRLTNRIDRWIVGLFYAVVIVLPPLVYLFDEGEISTSGCDGPCPDNVLSVLGYQPLATAIAIVYAVGSLGLALAVLVRMVQRWRGASPALRRSLAPVFAAAAVLIAIAVSQSIVGFFSEEAAEAINFVTLGAVLAVPLAFLYGLLRSRFAATTRRLVAELSGKPRPAEVQAVLRRVLRDPELELGYRVGDEYVDVDGLPLELPADGSSRAVTKVADEVIVHDAALRDQPELDEVLDAVHIAMERGLSLGSLESSQRRATALLEAIPDSMYRVAADGTFIEFRLSETARLPVEPRDLVGMNVRDILSPEATDEVFAAMKRAAANDTVEVVNYTLQVPGDPLRYLEARIVKSDQDESVAIVRDITERTLQQHALEALADEQAALSRVAVAVATASRPDVLFNVVTEEVARLLGADAANLIRFDRRANEGVIVGKWSEPGVPIPPAGTRLEVLGGPLERVLRTGRPARGGIDDPENPPALVARLNDLGVTSLVAAPIEVSGELWGAVVVSVTGDQTFAADAEERIGQFASLVAVALANAEARELLLALAEEQAALSRVAVAVATASEPEVLFNVVTEEVAHRLGSDAANLIRFNPRNELEGLVVGRWSSFVAEFASIGTRVELSGGPVTAVRRTGRPARGHIDDPDITPSPLVDQLRERGVRSMVAAPIEVSGELWGAVVVSLTGDRTFAEDAEERIGQFASLVAVALANAQAREELSMLADEQAALSRVAVAVATEGRPERLFNTVTEEVTRLFDAQWGSTIRYEDDEGVVVGNWHNADGSELKIGDRFALGTGAIGHVKRTGRPARVDYTILQSDDARQMVAAPIVVSGRLWGATTISVPHPRAFPSDAEERLGKFASLVAVALANVEAREELIASRARIVQAGDTARRRLERNLHDGAQQRLVTLSLTLRLAQAKLRDEPDAALELLEASSNELASALEELRELARGLHPAILSDHGLGAALESLATRTPVPVALDHVPPERLPPPVEAAAYYVVAESLTNVAKYAEASTAHVSVVRQDGFAIVEVADDGVGGVDISRGSGLRGLADRVEALDGRLTVSSEAGEGTRIRAEIPCR